MKSAKGSETSGLWQRKAKLTNCVACLLRAGQVLSPAMMAGMFQGLGWRGRAHSQSSGSEYSSLDYFLLQSIIRNQKLHLWHHNCKASSRQTHSGPPKTVTILIVWVLASRGEIGRHLSGIWDGSLIVLTSSNIIIMATELNQQVQAAQKQKKTSHASAYSVLDYASIRNLSQNTARKAPLKMLPGLGIKTQGSFLRKQQEDDEAMIEQPRLLTTAKARIQQLQEEAEAASESSNSNILGVSSFLNSREVTPSNPLAPHRRKLNPKNKLNSVTSELFDIQSNPEEEKGQPKFKSKDFKLYDIISGQSQAVYQHVFGRERTVNPKTILAWKDCLSHEDKSEIYLPFADSRPEIPYTSSRIYQLNQIQKGFKEIYGTGKNRSLTIGQEAMIIQAIEKYLKLCSKDPLKIGRKDFDILQDILSDCKMSELQELPMCMKQVEMHFKVMATKWRYSGALDHSDRILQAALVMGKNNFLDLNRQNPLTAFLLKHSNINDI